MTSIFSPLKRLPILLLALFLAGCYLPSRFKVDVWIGPDGSYTMSYVGRLADSTLFVGLKEGKIDAATETRKVETLKRDLARDSGFRAVEYVGEGFFEVRYEKAGNIIDDKTLTFVNGGSRILSIAFVGKSNTVTVFAGSVPVNYHDRLNSLSFPPEGELRVVTGANVLENNADQVSGEDEKTYLWILRTLDVPAPKIIIGG